MERLGQDVRHGLRMLAKRPGVAVVAVLALGIGTNTAIGGVLAKYGQVENYISNGNPARTTSVSKKIEPVVKKWLALRDAPGVAIGVVQDGKLVFAKGYGTRDIDHPERKIETRSLFHVASNSKPFVAAAILRLAERGKINLDAPVVRYLPYFELADPRYKEISVRQMLGHISGMPDEEDFQWGDSVEDDDGALERYVRSIKGKTLIAAPGSEYHYSNMAYEVLGDLISKVSGKTFEAYMKEEVLAPLDMRDSTFLLADVSPALLTIPHTRRLRTEVSKIRPYTRSHAPSSTLYSNVEELANWVEMILDGGTFHGKTFLKPEAFHEFITPQVTTGWGGYDDRAALPWYVGDYRGHTMISHKGRDLGYGSMLAIVPDQRLAVIVLGNAHFAPISQITEAILDILLGHEPAHPAVSVAYPVAKTLAEHDVDAAIDRYRTLRKEASEDYTFDENALNSLGYTLIRLKRFPDAIRIFELNTKEYPRSSNAFDSLGEAYLRAGDLERGRRSYEKALELDPKNHNAADILRKLRKEQRK